MMILAGDLGGTKTNLMLSRIDNGQLQTLAEQRYASGAFDDFHSLVHTFLREANCHTPPETACFAVAGPVHGDAQQQQAQLTNLPWELRNTDLQSDLAIARVELVNDFAANAFALDALSPAELSTLQIGSAQAQATRVVAGAGTGFGLCALCPDSNPLRVLNTEGGHAGFAPSNDRQHALWQFINQHEGRCTREHILSGAGIKRIFDFLCQSGSQPPSAALLATLTEQADPAAVISDYALRDADPVARDTLTLFSEIYGSVLGDIALEYLAHGGLYIAGGIAPKILAFLQTPDFLHHFNAKAPMQTLIRNIPVHVLLDTRLGLRGATQRALSMTDTQRRTIT